jgi:hypothetical protein
MQRPYFHAASVFAHVYTHRDQQQYSVTTYHWWKPIGEQAVSSAQHECLRAGQSKFQWWCMPSPSGEKKETPFQKQTPHFPLMLPQLVEVLLGMLCSSPRRPAQQRAPAACRSTLPGPAAASPAALSP